MKMMLCNDVKLAAICDERLDNVQSKRWADERVEKFKELIEKCSLQGIEYALLTGSIFGQSRVSESVIDVLFETATENSKVKIIAALSQQEFKRIKYRKDIPSNLKMICIDIIDAYLDKEIKIRSENQTLNIKFNENEIHIKRAASGKFELSGIPGKKEKGIKCFEPCGFDDDAAFSYGYSVIEWDDNGKLEFKEHKEQKYSYKSVELILLASDSQKDIEDKLAKIVASIKRDSFIRMEIKGKSPFGIMLNADALKSKLEKKAFYAEVFDNTIMDIDSDSFENDISLKSEFVRLALKDETLSEAERNRLICCGWNALSGEEVQ